MKKIRFVAKNRSHMMVFVVIMVLGYGLYSFFGEFAFFFHDKNPIALGSGMKINSDNLSKVKPGDYVEISGIRSIKGGKIQKGFLAVPHMIYFFLGNSDFVVVEKMDEDEEKNVGAQHVVVRGRIYPFKHSKNMMRMRSFFKNNFALEMNEDGYVISVGEKPGDDYFSLIVFLGLIFVAIYIIAVTVKNQFFPSEEDEDFEL